MTPTEPPLMATWLLEQIGRKNPSLAGDLLEEYRHGRSVAWYWRQVLIAIVLGPSKAALLVVVSSPCIDSGRTFRFRVQTHNDWRYWPVAQTERPFQYTT
jgi:hypothetical protein